MCHLKLRNLQHTQCSHCFEVARILKQTNDVNHSMKNVFSLVAQRSFSWAALAEQIKRIFHALMEIGATFTWFIRSRKYLGWVMIHLV